MCYTYTKSHLLTGSNRICVDIQGATGWIVVQALHQEVLLVKSSHQEFLTETPVLSHVPRESSSVRHTDRKHT